MTTGIDGHGAPTAAIGGARRAPVELAGSRSRGADPGASEEVVDGREGPRVALFGRFYEERGQELAQAVRVRQLDRALSRSQARAGEVRVDLEAVKLYPPYPLDEPRRAEAIRQFNGVAEEVARLVGHQTRELQLAPLRPEASTEEAEQAVAELGRVRDALAAKRAELVHRFGEGAGREAELAAEAESDSIGRQLGNAGETGLSREAGAILGRLS